MIVRVLERKLGERTLVAGLEACRVLGGALDETLLEGLDTWGQQVDVDRAVPDPRPYFLRTLDVDLDHGVLAAGEGLVHRLVGPPFELAVDRRPFEELVASDHRPERRLVHEEVGHAVNLAGTRRARGVRDAIFEGGIDVEQLTQHGVLADTARPGQHDEPALRAHAGEGRSRSVAATSSSGIGDWYDRSVPSAGWRRRRRMACSAGRRSVVSGRP